MINKIKAVHVIHAVCKGAGSDKYKTVTGITQKILREIKELEEKFGPLAVLVDSNTEYMGEKYKLVDDPHGYKNHRQIKFEDYEIVAAV